MPRYRLYGCSVLFLWWLIVECTMQIRDVQHKHAKADLRTAAFISAIDKIAVSYMELGIFP